MRISPPYSTTNQKQWTEKYRKEKQKTVVVRYKKEDYDSFIGPGIEKSGMAVATFAKKAIAEKLERDGLVEPGFTAKAKDRRWAKNRGEAETETKDSE